MERRPKARRYLHWPLGWRRAHAAAIVLLPVLLATGVALYLPQVHTTLIPYLQAIYDLHIALGAVWLGLIVVPVVRPPRFGGHRTLSGLDWLPLLALGVAAAATGIVLIVPLVFSAVWRQLEFTGHGVFALAVAVAVVLHALARWRRLVIRNARFRPERLAFLRFAAYGLLSAAALPWLGRLPEVLAGNGPSGMGAAPAQANGEFITYSVAGYLPDISEADYRLEVGGAVDAPYTLDFEALRALARTDIVRNFQCVTGWVVPSVRWTGVRLSDLLHRAGPRTGNDVIVFDSADGMYMDTLSLSQSHLEDVILAYELDGEPLTAARGGPVRLIVPEMYGYKSVKWVRRIRVAAAAPKGYWEARGYAVNAWIGTPPPPPACGFQGRPGPCN